ncbi:putative glycosyl hydrolase [Yarrowia sp. B02]|nr:putative glycosyl hydrolase [Yarrowia sp. B02]
MKLSLLTLASVALSAAVTVEIHSTVLETVYETVSTSTPSPSPSSSSEATPSVRYVTILPKPLPAFNGVALSGSVHKREIETSVDCNAGLSSLSSSAAYPATLTSGSNLSPEATSTSSIPEPATASIDTEPNPSLIPLFIPEPDIHNMGLGTKIRDMVSNVGPVAAADLSKPNQAPNDRTIFQTRNNHGPNIGSMFLLEKWLTPGMFPDSAKGDAELDAVSALVAEKGADGARQQFEQHWNSWLGDDDFSYLQSVGANAIRVPMGYWTINGGAFTQGTPFAQYQSVYQNAWSIFKTNVLDKAKAANIAVLIDLHAVPGGANGDAHSGTSSGKVEFWDSRSDQKLAVEALQWVAKDVLSYDNVLGIEVVNEAVYDASTQKEGSYYLRALEAIRKVNPDVPVYISDGWAPTEWNEWVQEQNQKLQGGQNTGFVVDSHVYKAFSEQDKGNSPQQNIANVPAYLNVGKAQADSIVGEFSCVFSEETWAKAGGEDREQLAIKYGQVQIESFNQNARAGWFFWTYKFQYGDGGDWGFKPMTAKGALPTFSNGGSNKDPKAGIKEAATKATEEHSAYWDQHKGNYEHWRFADGFVSGWQDAAAFYEFHGSTIGRINAWQDARRAQHIASKGNSGAIWEWDQGFDAGIQGLLNYMNSN